MKRLFVFMMLVLTASVISFAQDSNVRSTIEQNNQKMLQAMMNENVDAALALYKDDAISLPSYGPMVRGKDQIAANWRKDIEKGNKIKSMEFNTVEVREEGNVAIEVGTYTMSMTMKENAQEFSDEGKYVTVWEKDGTDWKVAMEIWNSNNNPWESMKDKDKQPGLE